MYKKMHFLKIVESTDHKDNIIVGCGSLAFRQENSNFTDHLKYDLATIGPFWQNISVYDCFC